MVQWGLSSTKILYECGFMHWRNLVTDAALQETFQDTESIDQFRITFAREMHFPSFKQDPENANENRLWQAALSLQDKKFKVKLWGCPMALKLATELAFGSMRTKTETDDMKVVFDASVPSALSKLTAGMDPLLADEQLHQGRTAGKRFVLPWPTKYTVQQLQAYRLRNLELQELTPTPPYKQWHVVLC